MATESRRTLTTRGRCLIAGGAAAALCALLLDERDLLRIGLVAIALPLVAVAVTIGRRGDLSARHHVYPDRLTPGGRATVRLTVTNRGTHRSRPIEVTDVAIAGLTDGARTLLPALAPRTGAQVVYPLRAERRGRFTIPSSFVRSGDPFGLWEQSQSLPGGTDILVVPPVVSLLGMPPARGSRSAASGAARIGTARGDPDAQVRPYVPGDDIRTIHWRASARRDDLVVRLREPAAHGDAAILLDHRAVGHRGSGPRASLEVAVSLAASIALHLIAADYQVRLVGHGGATIATGNDIADDVLAALAEVTPSDDALRVSGLHGSGLVIAVLGELDPSECHLLAAGRPPGADGIAFLIDAHDWSPEADGRAAVAAAAVLRAGGWRTVVVHRGDDLAAAWRLACGSTYDPARPGSGGRRPERIAAVRPPVGTAGLS